MVLCGPLCLFVRATFTMDAVRRLEGSIGHQQRRVVPFFLSGALVNLHARVEIERDTKNIEVAQRIDGESEDPRVRESEVETARSRNFVSQISASHSSSSSQPQYPLGLDGDCRQTDQLGSRYRTIGNLLVSSVRCR